MNCHIRVVAHLSKFVKLNKTNQPMEQLYIAREKVKNILSNVDFSKLWHIIMCFPELNQKIGQE